MSRISSMLTPIAALVVVAGLGAAPADSSSDAGSAAVTAAACDATPPPPPSSTAPSPPTNLRIIAGSIIVQPTEQVQISGAYAAEDLTAVAASGSHAYFDMLAARPDCFMSLHLRSQAQLDSLPTGANVSTKMPVSYDWTMDAARFAIDPSGASPNSGSTDTQQKRPYIGVSGVPSMLLTWDTRFDGAFAWETGKLAQHKTWRLITDANDIWLTWKTTYSRGATTGRGVAELMMSSQTTRYATGGTNNTQYGSEILAPRVTDFYIHPDTWTRYWFFVEGKIEEGQTVYISAWAADEEREPIPLYQRLPYLSPKALSRFYFVYDTSQDEASNALSQSWNRNLVILSGLSLSDVTKLLQKPTN